MSRKDRRAHLQPGYRGSDVERKVRALCAPTRKFDEPKDEPGKIFENEEVLPDDYPVYPGYCYVADGRVIRSMIRGSVRALKADIPATEIRRCNMGARDLW